MPRNTFSKGNKFGKGRPKGSPNKTTKEMKELLQSVLSERLDELQSDLDRMSPGTRWTVLDKLCKYVMPSLSKSEIEGNIDGDIKIKVVYDDLNGDENRNEDLSE